MEKVVCHFIGKKYPYYNWFVDIYKKAAVFIYELSRD